MEPLPPPPKKKLLSSLDHDKELALKTTRHHGSDCIQKYTESGAGEMKNVGLVLISVSVAGIASGTVVYDTVHPGQREEKQMERKANLNFLLQYLHGNVFGFCWRVSALLSLHLS